MHFKLLRRAVAICLLTLVALGALLAQDTKALLGKWNMTSETNGDSLQWTLVLKEEQGVIKAALASDQGEQEAKDFTFKDGVMKFKAPYQNEYYDIELKVAGDKLDGTWSGGGDSGKTTGTKAP